jgi:putative flippase GtrA
MIKNFFTNNQKLISYAFFGGMGVLLDLGLYTTLVSLDINYQIANASGYATGTLMSFFLNREYTFKIKDKILKRLISFFGVAFIGYIFSALLLYIFITIFTMDEVLSKFISLFFVLVIQFTLNKKITFKE